MNNIEELINEIDNYIDSCKPQAFSGSKRVIVDKDILAEYFSELRIQIPKEIDRCDRIISNKEAIIDDARAQAERIIKTANQQNSQLLDEHELVQQATQMANQIIADAQKQAKEIQDYSEENVKQMQISAIQYTDDLLANVQELIAKNVENINNKYTAFINDLDDTYNIVTTNRQELKRDLPQDYHSTNTYSSEHESYSSEEE